MTTYSISTEKEMELCNMNVFQLLTTVSKEIDDNSSEEQEVLINAMFKIIEIKIQEMNSQITEIQKDIRLAQTAKTTAKYFHTMTPPRS